MSRETKRQRECSSRCQRAKTPAQRCRCVCHGASHGSANMIPELSTSANGEPTAAPPISESEDFDIGRTYALVRGNLEVSPRLGWFVETESGQRAYLEHWLSLMPLDRGVLLTYSKEVSGRLGERKRRMLRNMRGDRQCARAFRRDMAMC